MRVLSLCYKRVKDRSLESLFWQGNTWLKQMGCLKKAGIAQFRSTCAYSHKQKGNHCGLQRQKGWLLLTLGLILNLCVSVSVLKNGRIAIITQRVFVEIYHFNIDPYFEDCFIWIYSKHYPSINVLSQYATINQVHLYYFNKINL